MTANGTAASTGIEGGGEVGRAVAPHPYPASPKIATALDLATAILTTRFRLSPPVARTVAHLAGLAAGGSR